MKLKNFIKKLEKLSIKHGNNINVVMADNIPVLDPIFFKEYPDKKKIILTDQK